jgi:hypothetical protein
MRTSRDARRLDAADRYVTHLPPADLFDAQGRVEATRGAGLDVGAITRHLRVGGTIVLARVGKPLEWLQGDAAFACWETELKLRLWEPDRDKVDLEEFEDARAWRATAWRLADGREVAVFEQHH